VLLKVRLIWACWCLQVIKLISQVIADFANGEISQATALFDTDLSIQQYLDKSFFKTASLIAASCRSAAVFSDCDNATKDAMFQYGKHLGLAFQVLCHPDFSWPTY
jgi:all-trans-nonaprenyl-diphosphate synthase